MYNPALHINLSQLSHLIVLLVSVIFAFAASIGTEPSLLVQRCNGTTAGMGYLEVLELSMQILLLGQLASVRTVNSQWGRRIQFLY